MARAELRRGRPRLKPSLGSGRRVRLMNHLTISPASVGMSTLIGELEDPLGGAVAQAVAGAEVPPFVTIGDIRKPNEPHIPGTDFVRKG